MLADRFNTVIVGGGPAALAPLVSASRDGTLEDLLRQGIVLIERGPKVGAGRLGSYAIWSDSTAQTFLTAVTDHLDPRLGSIKDHPLFEELTAIGQGPIPLVKAAELMCLVGQVLHRAIVDAGGLVLVGHEAVSSRRTLDGGWLTSIRRIEGGGLTEIRSRNIVLATGGEQPMDRLRREIVGGEPLLPRYSDKLVQSDSLLQPAGLALAIEKLAGCKRPRVAIVGGSTSAMATADLLLKEGRDLFAQPGSIALLHRRPLRVFYRSQEEALAENYTDFGPEDICPISGFVFRLAGFRLHSRQLLMRILAIGPGDKEERVILHRLDPQRNFATQQILDDADIIVAAMGYRPRALPLFDVFDQPITLMADGDRGPMVDLSCRILATDGARVPAAFGIGLAAGFVPSGALGGEKSFSGQANGLWLWQTAVGGIVVDSLIDKGSREPSEQPWSSPTVEPGIVIAAKVMETALPA